jgi:hypothetical protein
MSIIRPILRMCVVAALRERTLAERRVFDSDNTPLADALAHEPEQAKPYITVYTDEDTRLGVAGAISMLPSAISRSSLRSVPPPLS